MDKRRVIFTEAYEGKAMLETLKSGQNILDTCGNQELIERRFMQLLHFRQYTKMYEYIFLEWGSEDGMEQTYLEVANEARELHVLLNDDVFTDLFLRLLRILWEYTDENPVQINSDRMEKMTELWKDAGLIRDGGGENALQA